MDHKNILITGSGSGLGRAMAIKLGEDGHNIILNGRTESKLIETEKLLKNFKNALILIIALCVSASLR